MSLLSNRHAALLLLALSVTTPVVARAEAPASSTEQDRAEGKARYERGVEAYSAGRYKDAIDLFLQADVLAPSAALSFNIARAYERIGDDAATLQWYRDFRRRDPTAKNAAEVDARISALEAELARKGVQQLTILSEPHGATVIVDDKPLGVTPFTGQLAPGSHRVLLTLKGYEDAAQELTLAADRARDLRVTLAPLGVDEAPAPVSEKAVESPRPAREREVDKARFGPWPWVSLAAGGAALGASLGFELARRSAEDAAKDEPTQVGYKEKLDTEQSRQAAARVLLGVGGALVVTGGVLWAIDWSTRGKAKPQTAQLGALCLPGGCAVNLRGDF